MPAFDRRAQQKPIIGRHKTGISPYEEIRLTADFRWRGNDFEKQSFDLMSGEPKFVHQNKTAFMTSQNSVPVTPAIASKIGLALEINWNKVGGTHVLRQNS